MPSPRTAARIASLVLLVPSLSALGLSSAQAAPRCHGHKVTMVVDSHSAHRVHGTRNADVILVRDAGHIVNGGGGNDTMCGSSGHDDLRGGAGNDTILGRGGDDDLAGGRGDDDLRGGAGDDHMDGNAGDDDMHGGIGDDDLGGGSGDDDLVGGAGDDTCHGGLGHDVGDDDPMDSHHMGDDETPGHDSGSDG